jgi:hypothetical protein
MPELECAYCERTFATPPVRDEIEVFWLGDQAKVWCSEDCRDSYAERAAS